jgi:hypothetical protein
LQKFLGVFWAGGTAAIGARERMRGSFEAALDSGAAFCCDHRI